MKEAASRAGLTTSSEGAGYRDEQSGCDGKCDGRGKTREQPLTADHEGAGDDRKTSHHGCNVGQCHNAILIQIRPLPKSNEATSGSKPVGTRNEYVRGADGLDHPRAGAFGAGGGLLCAAKHYEEAIMQRGLH